MYLLPYALDCTGPFALKQRAVMGARVGASFLQDMRSYENRHPIQRYGYGSNQ